MRPMYARLRLYGGIALLVMALSLAGGLPGVPQAAAPDLAPHPGPGRNRQGRLRAPRLLGPGARGGAGRAGPADRRVQPDAGADRRDRTRRSRRARGGIAPSSNPRSAPLSPLNHEGLIVAVGIRRPKRMFGHRSADVIGRALADVLIPPALREGHRRGLAAFSGDRRGPASWARRVEITGLRADGVDVSDVELSISRMPGAGPAMFTQLPARHHRAQAGRPEAARAAGPARPPQPDHPRDRRAPGPAQHLPGGGVDAGGQPADRLRVRLPVRAGGRGR